MVAKILMMVVFIAAVVAIGLRTRNQAGSVEGFVLGGRNVGPWLSAFAFGTSYFSAVIFVGYAGQFGWKYGISATWIGVGNAFIGEPSVVSVARGATSGFTVTPPHPPSDSPSPSASPCRGPGLA